MQKWISELVRQILLNDYERLGTWEEVGKKYGLNKGYVWMMANGKKNIPTKVLKKMGFRQQYKDLFAMPVKELLWRLKNREVVQGRKEKANEN